jgi:hypothetical protein
MKSPLSELLVIERGRVFAPPPDFTQRVLTVFAQQQPTRPTFWESVSSRTASTVLAMALALVLILLSLDIVIPARPNRGLTQIYMESEISTGERWLFLEPQTPPAVVFAQLISE